ncbi:YwqG family protein [Paenibacillus spongiae]|uniref:DUF1963 domain-containing protein n=1 Tax=Paenibacillus spongiae TaxID=2909671 RepID=A0ABY5S772_9BACL|nr:YwqG family protein [Paenibacillus spongiae]UVI29348.1 DUF1963 domain-containing protein [Paenibacillus spongiae]
MLTKEKSEEDIPIGASKLGGRPDLPKGMPWPYLNTPYSFIGQVNLADIEEAERYLLPKSGMLYFFLAAHNLFGRIGDYYNEQNARVFYVNDGIALERTDFPHDLNPNWIYRACEIKYSCEPNVPPVESSAAKSFGISLEDKYFIDKYWRFHKAFVERHCNADQFITKLMGYPDQYQADLQYQCDHESPLDWILLFQADSDYFKTNMMWGDYGRLYFLIRQQDLIEGLFDNSYVIYQC